MARSSRRKGIAGEAEVARLLRAAGYTVRGLEAAGDWLCALAGGRWLHVEVKRAERLKVPEWLRQAESEAPEGTVPVLVWRQNRGRWYACLPLSELLDLLGDQA